MLVDEKCSIYDDRPLACRQYDCRVFAATGLSVSAEGKPAIDQQGRRWRFAHLGATDRLQHDAVKEAASFLRDHADEFPTGLLPQNATQLAMVAVLVHALFLDDNRLELDSRGLVNRIVQELNERRSSAIKT
jgi:hypothetical protein